MIEIERYSGIDTTKSKWKRKCTMIICLGVLLVMTVVMFHSYIWGDKYFLFPEVVTDAVVQFYPGYAKMAEANAMDAFFFSYAWGGTLSFYSPFDILVTLFGSAHIAYMMGIVVMLKSIMAGMMFCAYLNEKGMQKLTCVVFGISYAFSVQVLACGCWQSQAELAIASAIFLFAVEAWKKKRKTTAFAVGIIFSYICVNFYYQLFLVAFFVLYVAAELFMSDYKWKGKFSRKKKAIAGLCVVLLIVAVWVILQNMLLDIVHSYRFQEGLGNLQAEWDKTFSKANLKIIVTAILRTFAPNILGIPGENTYYGSDSGWYIGDGSYYCGILTLLILPQAFQKGKKKRNIVFFIECMVCVFLVSCPLVRLVVNGFSNDVYKLTRMWVIVVMINMAAVAFDEIMENPQQLNVKILWITWGASAFFLIGIILYKMQDKIYYYDVICYLLFSGIYVILLTLYGRKKLQTGRIYHGIFLSLVMVELLCLNYQFFNNSDSIAKEDWQNGYYNDGTKELIAQAGMGGEFQRIDKNYQSVYLNDALAQAYNGTSYYIGGSGNNDFTDLIRETSIPTLFNRYGWCFGTYGFPELEAVFAVDKIITNSGNCSSYGFEQVCSLNGKTLYQNKYSLPLAFGYDRVMTKEEFDALDPLVRADSLLKYAVIDNEDIDLEYVTAEQYERKEVEPISRIELADYQFGTPISIDADASDETVVMEMQDSDSFGMQVNWVTKNNECGNYFASLYEQNGKTQMTISNQEGIDWVCIYLTSETPIDKIDYVSVSVYKSADYYEEYEANVEKRKSNVLKLQECSDEYMKGTIDLDEKQLLYISIPYKANFKYYVDGTEVKKEKVNVAFSGIYLEEGKHEIEMVYQSELKNNKWLVSCGLLFGYAVFCGIRKCYKRKG